MAKEKKYSTNDLLFPIIFILSLLPFVTRLLIYDCSLSSYSWFPKNGISSDFFTYYKGVALIIIAVLCTFILPISLLVKSCSKKQIKQFIPLLIYFVFVSLSTIFSDYKAIALSGTNGHFEGFYVLMAYMILCLYSYFVSDIKKDTRLILISLVFTSIGMCVIGFCQIFLQDPIQWDFIQKLVMSADNYKNYAGSLHTFFTTNAVSLTLANPNYASTFLAMLISFFSIYLISIPDKKKKIALAVLLLGLFSILFMTLSRAGLLAVFVSLLVLLFILRKELLHHKKGLLISIFILFTIYILFDAVNSFQYSKKIVATFQSLKGTTKEENLEQIITGSDSIRLTYQQETINVSFQNTATQTTLHFEDAKHNSQDVYYNSTTGKLDITPFDKLTFQVSKDATTSFINITIDGTIWSFCYTKNDGYNYFNYFERLEKLNKIPTLGFKGHENLASNRAYIWSRTLPLLKNSIVIGSGPDTFPIVYPQNDRVGKLYNCKYVYSIVEKAHSLYLQIATQTGVLSLVAFLIFYGIYLVQTLRSLKNFSTSSPLHVFALACLLLTISYMTSGLFNDSVIQTSPMFWVMLGLGFSTNAELGKKK